MVKFNLFPFVFPALVVLLAGCSAIQLSQQKSSVAAPKVQLIHYFTAIELNGTGSLHNFRTPTNQSFDELLKTLDPEILKESRIRFSANLSPLDVQELSDQLHQYGFRQTQISQSSQSAVSAAQMTLKFSHSALVQSDCYDGAGTYRFGCAVNWNRAVSLRENREIQRASAPGFSPARLERPAHQSERLNNSNMIEARNDE